MRIQTGTMRSIERFRELTLRLSALYVGLWLYGFSMALMVTAGLGLDPWDVFHQGVSRHLSLSFGTITALTGILVLLAWIPLRQKPGLGTVSNVVVIAIAVDVSLGWLPDIDALLPRAALLVTGIVMNAFATALYIGAGMGPGPRDGLMTGLVARTGLSIRLVRTAIELTVVATGWLLGGNVGLGTLLYAFGIGPLVQVFMTYLPSLRRTRTVAPDSTIGDPASTGDGSRGTPVGVDESNTGANLRAAQVGHARVTSVGPPECTINSELASSTGKPSGSKERTSEPSTHACSVRTDSSFHASAESSAPAESNQTRSGLPVGVLRPMKNSC